MQKGTTVFKKLIPWALMLLVPAANCYLLDFYTHNPFETMAFRVHVMNLLLFFFLAVLGLSLTGSVRAALSVLTVFCAGYGLAGYYVLSFRGVPIQPWDLFSLDTAASVANHYDYSLNSNARIVLACFFLLFLLSLLPKTSWFSKKNKRSALIRLGLFLTSALFLFCYTSMLHNEKIVEQKLRLYDKLFTPTVIQSRNGTLTAFLMELQYLSVEKPEGYSDQAAQTLLSSYEPKQTDAEDLPNIIVIMNEAFSDPAVLGDFSTNEDYMPFVHQLLAGAENTVSGHLHVSVKGGNTANTEFEYLTGNTMAFLPYGSIPYQQYIRGNLPTMASYLASLGYHTVAMHPYRAAGWNRDHVYPQFGFSEIHFQEFFSDSARIRNYVSDIADYEKIIQVYQEKPAGKPLFLFNVTMQNHSSYSDWDEYDNFSPRITVANTSSKILPAYLSLIRISDDAIFSLVDYFSRQEEKTILVFFGDHQPADSVVEPILKQNNTGSSQLTEEEEFLRYEVPFFIWANYDIPEEKDVDTSANFLGAKTLRAAGIEPPAYFSFLDALSQTVPVVSASHVQTADGTVTDVKAQYDLLSDYRLLQYNQLFAAAKETEESEK